MKQIVIMKRLTAYIIFSLTVVCAYAQKDSTLVATDSINKEMALPELTVTASNVTHHADKDVWLITDEMRQNTLTVIDLVERIPGITYDRMKQSLKYMGQDNVIIVLDGKVKDSRHVGELDNKRFAKVEVVRRPHGRFRDYDAVINLVSKDNWQGYDLQLREMGQWKPACSHESNALAFQNLDYQYTRGKTDLAAGLELRNSRNKYSRQEETVFNNTVRYLYTPADGHSGRRYGNSQKAWVDMDYDFNRNHSLSVRYQYTPSHDTQRERQHLQKEWLGSGLTESTYRNIFSESEGHNHSAALFYRGNWGLWKAYSDLTYDYEKGINDMKNHEDAGFATAYSYDSRRHSLRYKADVNRSFKDGANLDLGALLYHRSYKSEERTTDIHYKSHFNQQQLYAEYSRNLGRGFNAGIGLTTDFLHTNQDGQSSESDVILAAKGHVSYMSPTGKLIANLNYSATNSHPTLFLKMNTRVRTDSLTAFRGNEGLKSSTTHQTTLQVIAGKLMFFSTFSYSPDQMAHVYETDGLATISTYDNIRALTYNNMLSYNLSPWMIGSSMLQLSALLTFSGCKHWRPGTPEGRKSHADYWSGSISVRYTTQKKGEFYMSLYPCVEKSATLQSHSTKQQSLFNLSYSKRFLKDRLSLMVVYNMPYLWPSRRESVTTTETPFYWSRTTQMSYHSDVHQLMLSLSYKLSKGKQVNKKFNNIVVEKDLKL